jgi:hypothetical protein
LAVGIIFDKVPDFILWFTKSQHALSRSSRPNCDAPHKSPAIFNLILKKQKEGEFLTKAEKKNKKKKNVTSLDKVIIAVKKYEPEDFRKIIQFIFMVGVVDSESDASCVDSYPEE